MSIFTSSLKKFLTFIKRIGVYHVYLFHLFKIFASFHPQKRIRENNSINLNHSIQYAGAPRVKKTCHFLGGPPFLYIHLSLCENLIMLSLVLLLKIMHFISTT